MKTFIKNKRILFIIIYFFMSISCKKDDDFHNVSIINTWKLISVISTSDNQTIVVPQDINISIAFKDSSEVICHSVCNSGYGRFTIKNDSLNIDCSLTKMACPQGIEGIDWESIIRSNIGLVRKYILSDEKLTLKTEGYYNLNFIIQK